MCRVCELKRENAIKNLVQRKLVRLFLSFEIGMSKSWIWEPPRAAGVACVIRVIGNVRMEHVD